MLKIEQEVSRGIMFIRLMGNLNKNSFSSFGKVINNLLYKQGMQYFVIDLYDINLEDNIFLNIQNKLVEIFLSSGKVVLCGIDDKNKGKIGYTKDKLFYVKEEREAFKYLWM